MTIHQPRQEIFAAFDKVALLFAGDLGLFCTPSAALKCMAGMADLIHWNVRDVSNPADVMLDFLQHDVPAELIEHEIPTIHRSSSNADVSDWCGHGSKLGDVLVARSGTGLIWLARSGTCLSGP